ncbi:serine hydrolase [bacterium]|nr:serine hydrolase [bacterium]
MRLTVRSLVSLALLGGLSIISAHAGLTRDQIRRIDRLFAPLNYPDIPGCAVGIIQDGTLVYERGFGMASLESGLPNDVTTPFHIYSMSKQFTAFCILLLAREGRLSLDDDVRKYIPEMPDYGRPITLRHLCHHTAGLRDYLALVYMAGKNTQLYRTEEGVLPLLARQKDLNFPVGEEHSYTNSGYLLLSLVVERVSGLTLREFADRRIFKPLGMKQTHFHDDYTEVVPYRAWGYYTKNDQETEFGLSFEPSNLVMGCGGMMSTVRDLLLWDRNFYHPIVGDASLIAEMQVPGKLNDGRECNYGLGLYLSRYNGLRTIGHSGAFGAFRSEWVQFPEANFSVIVLANYSEVNPGNFVYRIADICLSDRFREEESGQKPPPDLKFVELPRSALEDKVGSYRNTETGSIYRFYIRGATLSVSTRSARFDLAAVSDTLFVGVNTPTDRYYRFEWKPQPEGGYHVQALYDGRREWLLVPQYTVEHTPDDLLQFAGEYYNDELEVVYRFEVEDDQLFVRQGEYRRGPLQPAPTERPEPSDVFRLGGTQYAFLRDAQGGVEGFKLHAGRVQNLRFQRVDASPAPLAGGTREGPAGH